MSSYLEKWLVLIHNDEKFIKDFKRCTVMVRLSWAGSLLPMNKGPVWRLAKCKKITYEIVPCPPYRDRMVLYDTVPDIKKRYERELF